MNLLMACKRCDLIIKQGRGRELIWWASTQLATHGQQPVFWLSDDSQFSVGKAIRGGITIMLALVWWRSEVTFW